MSLQSIVEKVRSDCQRVLSERGLTQQEFAERHELSYSWLNKFLNARDTDWRIGSVEELQQAVSKEKRAS